MSTKIQFKSDRFKKNRGGCSQWMLLNCEKCKHPIFLYQKDGSGILKRLYFDRIINSKKFIGKSLICKKCKALLGIRMVYQKEKRLAYRLFAGAIEKKIVKSDKVLRIDF